MARTKGSTTKNPAAVPDTVMLTTEERVEFLANLIVDRMIEDQADGQELLKGIGGSNDARPIALA
jgi:hypothetical protein